MATASEVKAGLDDIATEIRANRAAVLKAIQNASAVSAALTALPAAYQDVIDTIAAYTGANEFETQAQAELAVLTTEFNALKVVADAIAAANP